MVSGGNERMNLWTYSVFNRVHNFEGMLGALGPTSQFYTGLTRVHRGSEHIGMIIVAVTATATVES